MGPRVGKQKNLKNKKKSNNATTWDRTKDLSVNSRPLCQRSSGGNAPVGASVLEDTRRTKKEAKLKNTMGRVERSLFIFIL